MHSLRALDLSSETWLGDAGLAALDLPALEYFHCYMGATDAGLTHLKESLPRLLFNPPCGLVIEKLETRDELESRSYEWAHGQRLQMGTNANRRR